jgi:NTE family protein
MKMKKLIALLLCSILSIMPGMTQKKIGLCLSGGGALGFAHIGVLKALEDNGIKPNVISGASIGAIIGALYANGMSPNQIYGAIEKNKMYSVLNIIKLIGNGPGGMSDTEKVRTILEKYLQHDSFDSLKMKLYISMTSLNKADWIIVGEGGDLIGHILASMSIPGVFNPTQIGEDYFIDGGIMNNLPVEPLIGNCDVIIGVDVHFLSPLAEPINSTAKMVLWSYSAMMKEMQKKRVAACNYYIPVLGLQDYNPADFKNYKEFYNIGYQAGVTFIQAHPEMIEACSSQAPKLK